ncbi:MAG: tetratricopeptide repeat protein [Thermoflavifilum sp.]|nr:tetratricopeptide repeat protein [Thermoflavifilum sp.]
MMAPRDDFFDESHELQEILHQFERLRKGESHAFLDEDDFEQIIDYFDDCDQLHQAIQAADLGIERFPYSATLMLKKADLLIAMKKYRQALEVLELAEIYDQSQIHIYLLKTEAYLALGEYDKAAQMLESRIDQFDGEEQVELLIELSDVYDDWDEFDRVFDCLVRVLHIDPNHEEALHKICFWTEYCGRYEESIQLHQKIIDEYPYNELAWFNLGAAYQGLKLYEKAIDAYAYALAIDEKFEYAYRNMADAYIKLRKYDRAIDLLQQHLQITNPEDVIYEAIGHCYEKQKQFTQARLYYRKAFRLSPHDDKLQLRIGLTYMLERNWMNAAEVLQHAITLNPQSVKGWEALGECMLQLHREEEAIHCFAEATKIRPSSVQAWQQLIRALYLADAYEEAYQQSYIAEAHTGSKAIYHYYRTAILLAMGRYKEALIQLEAGLQMAPRQLKKLIDLNPAILQRAAINDLISRYRKK